MIINSLLDYWKNISHQVAMKFPHYKSEMIWTWKNFKDDILSLKGRLGVEQTYVDLLGLSLDFESGETLDTIAGGNYPTDDLVGYLFYYSKAQEAEHSSLWVHYHQLTGTSGSVPGFKNKTTQVILETYSQYRERVIQVIEKLGGVLADYGDTAYILAPLPYFRLLLIFHDEDDEFPSEFRLLYNQHAIYYQPPEYLGVIASFSLSRIINLVSSYPKSPIR
jgi:hypothetical protein